MGKSRKPAPMTLANLVKQGGPIGMARKAAERAAKQEMEFWLSVLEQHAQNPRLGLRDQVYVREQIKGLRRRLGLKTSPETIRAQTRERVRRYRERKQSKGD